MSFDVAHQTTVQMVSFYRLRMSTQGALPNRKPPLGYSAVQAHNPLRTVNHPRRNTGRPLLNPSANHSPSRGAPSSCGQGCHCQRLGFPYSHGQGSRGLNLGSPYSRDQSSHSPSTQLPFSRDLRKHTMIPAERRLSHTSTSATIPLHPSFPRRNGKASDTSR